MSCCEVWCDCVRVVCVPLVPSRWIVKAVITSVTIVVVAIPEGLVRTRWSLLHVK